MNREWVRQKLKEYLRLLERLGIDPHDMDPVDRDELRDDLLRREPTIREIFKQLCPDMADVDLTQIGKWTEVRKALIRALGILDDRDEWAVNLAPDTPVLPAGHLHPWVWDAARTLWDSEHYRLAVQAAATAINAHAQAKLGRRDIADDKLMQEAFSDKPAGPGKHRLRYPGDPSNVTVQSCQHGALQYAVGCFKAIRNPATHEHAEWDQQIALEYLAALSVLARWIDNWKIAIRP